MTQNKIQNSFSCRDKKSKSIRFAIMLVALVVLFFVSLFLGSRDIPLSETIAALLTSDMTNSAHLVILEMRLPRTCIAILAGAGLGMSGAIMQAMTRNPLVEPGLIGINAGAAFAVLVGISMFHVTAIIDYVWFGFLGAALAAIIVFWIQGLKGNHYSQLHLVLSGIGLTIVLSSATGLLLINSPSLIFDQFRHWSAGSIEGRGKDVVLVMVTSIFVGVILTCFIAQRLNIMMLGPDLGAALGVNIKRTWCLAFFTIVILAGASTAAIGPVSFIGLVAPHMARIFWGTDYRWLLPSSALLAGILLLLADVVGRIIAAPNEVPAGIIALIIGGPFFIFVVRRYRLIKI